MCTEAEKKKYGFSLGGKVNFARRHHFTDALIVETTPTKEMLDHKFSTYSKICCPCVGTASNANQSGPQKELLLWHWKLGISMYQIQELMQPIKAHESSFVCHDMSCLITSIFKSTSNLKSPPICQSCQLACSKHKVPKVNQPTKAKQDQDEASFQDAYEVGNLPLLIKMLSTHQANCFWVTTEKSHTINFMMAP